MRRCLSMSCSISRRSIFMSICPLSVWSVRPTGRRSTSRCTRRRASSSTSRRRTPSPVTSGVSLCSPAPPPRIFCRDAAIVIHDFRDVIISNKDHRAVFRRPYGLIKKSLRASRPQTRKVYDPFFAAACAWQKTLCAAFIPSRLYSQRGTGGGFRHDDLFVYALLKLRHVGYHADEPPPAREARQKLHRLPQ